ncbi:preprotein translocase subunit YajC [Candidatus Kinetoplastibacterium desouzaii TCC079E]|uniref:Sec translocon accessory complex subunit YajC n=1 Tax=Candidatus Kinetoplastidibacterium desouzai TCC079E TaxID=1208919 RepID=M1LLQ1_9PROT|nr:preprotein translocase subunit YajC [Candidatus Kinetoplastibacterium desouzaii]AGF46677.1 preprotein translocase subunit YajC [Candidatus Kinetoplastibacterium desouzaii TCC079E]
MYTTNFPTFVLAQANASEGNAIISMLPIIIMFVVLYFLMIRPQVKRQKEHKELLNSLAKGDEVSTSGGIMGTINNVQDNYIFLEVSILNNQAVEIIVQKNSVIGVMPKGTIKSL